MDRARAQNCREKPIGLRKHHASARVRLRPWQSRRLQPFWRRLTQPARRHARVVLHERHVRCVHALPFNGAWDPYSEALPQHTFLCDLFRGALLMVTRAGTRETPRTCPSKTRLRVEVLLPLNLPRRSRKSG